MEEQIKELIKNSTAKEKMALKESVTVLYLSDSSDYINGLYDVVKAIVGEDMFYSDDFNVDDVYKLLRSE